VTPVFQTRFGATRGNCMQAAAASFLDLPLDTVPDFGQHGGWAAMVKFFRGYSYTLIVSEVGKVPVGYYFEVGVSTQLHEHIVICQMGRVVHDPNPTGRGLIMRRYVLWPRPG
jgi:hypothetical protein